MDISVFAKPQYDKAGGHNVISTSIVGGNSTYSPSFSTSGGNQISSPSLAEGARGWVDTTSTLQVNLTTANRANISVANNANANVSVIASERSERGKTSEAQFLEKTRRSRSFFSNPQKGHRLPRTLKRFLQNKRSAVSLVMTNVIPTPKPLRNGGGLFKCQNFI